MRPFDGIFGVWTAIALLCPSGALMAQNSDPIPGAGGIESRLVGIGSAEEDRLRMAQLLGRYTGDGFLLRSTSSLTASLLPADSGFSVRVLSPHLSVARNSDLPSSWGDGTLWAGRGWSSTVIAGARLVAGPVTLTLAPTISYLENLDFQIRPVRLPGIDSLAQPWYAERGMIDLPQRLGGDSSTWVDWGQSTLAVTTGSVVGGLSSETQWWGPGVRNALVLSDNAPGFPHLYLRTARPLDGPLGRWEAKWVLGGLAESAYFDTVATNDHRALNAVVVTLAPSFEPHLTLGLARAIYSTVDGVPGILGHAADVALVGNARQKRTPGGELEGTDQITSLFFRWIIPEQGFETYAEWARRVLPTSLRDWLQHPGHSQGYTLGLQWARPVSGSALVRLQTEVSNLEQSASFKQRPVGTFYVSRAVPQGYTHRGEVLGAGVGPGASSQWLAADLLGSRARFGLFAARTRWNNDAYYRSLDPNTIFAHDVSLFGGARIGHRHRWIEWQASYGIEQRYNYLFQNPIRGHDPSEAVDIRNRLFRLTVSPAGTLLPWR